MYRNEIAESAPIVIAVLDALLQWAPARGREGADLRAKAGILRINVEHYLQANSLGEPMAELFDLAMEGGITLPLIDNVRRAIELEYDPSTAGAIVVKGNLINLILVTEGRIVASMDFRSRQDVEALKETVNDAFNSAAEAVADRMDAMTYRAIVALHAAITFYLIESARPRPRMLNYQFNQPMTTLTAAYRLYADASRGDELRYENKCVHPAFLLQTGRALAA